MESDIASSNQICTYVLNASCYPEISPDPVDHHLSVLRDERRWIYRLFNGHVILNRVSTGEGGTFALYQGLYPPEDVDSDADRTLTGDSVQKSTWSTSSRVKKALQMPLLVWVS